MEASLPPVVPQVAVSCAGQPLAFLVYFWQRSRWLDAQSWKSSGGLREVMTGGLRPTVVTERLGLSLQKASAPVMSRPMHLAPWWRCWTAGTAG